MIHGDPSRSVMKAANVIKLWSAMRQRSLCSNDIF